jgi:large subunit ribosomal protein L9
MKTIELLLLDNVANLGIIGDVVKVKPGYARNYLLPFGLGTKPSEAAIKRLAARRAEVAAEMAVLRKEHESLIEKINGIEITLERSANEQGVLYGGVTQHEIGEALRAEGFDMIEDRHVRVGQQMKRLDSYQIPVVLDKELKAEVKLWIVSDKPAEELEAEGEVDGELVEEGGSADEPVTAEVDE